jgi:hypothetical protein
LSGISILCKSYRDDLDRAVTLAKSVRQFNHDELSFYISVPNDDLVLFQNRIGNEGIVFITDEEIISTNGHIDINRFKLLPGQLSQQIVKSEFWRINPLENFLCVDSDSRFIRKFSSSDFLAPDGNPYTVLNEGKDYLTFCAAHRIGNAAQNFRETALQMQQFFDRTGPLYNFGPFPVIWNRQVWQALNSFLASKGETIVDAILRLPHEASWYGETLLSQKSIPLLPIEPLFKAYLYYEQFESDQQIGINENLLSQNYLGVVYQSNWYPKRLQPLKKLSYKIKRQLKRWRTYD